MPRLFVPAEEWGGAEATLTGESHHYLTRVLRFGAGARVELFDGRGQEVTATIVRVGPRDAVLSLGERRQVTLRALPPVTLMQGLPRAERMDMIVQKATELGAARIVPVRAARSAAGQQGRPERWARIAREAARQCGRAELPEITPVLPLAEALATLVPGTRRIVPWEEAPDAAPLVRLVSAERHEGRGVDVLVGPEGGLTAEEIDLARAAGFAIATLGPRILRTETAAIATLALVQGALGGLG